MRRSSVFALVALVFLLVVLLGSWVYVENYSWPFSEGGSDSSANDDQKTQKDHNDIDPFADLPDPDAEAGASETGRSGPLEGIPRDETERARPPESIETRRPAGSAEVGKQEPGHTIEAVWAGGQPAVRDSEGGVDYLDPFIVSTLTSGESRAGAIRVRRDFQPQGLKVHTSTPVVASSKIHDIPQFPGLPYVMIGKVKWPKLESEKRQELAKTERIQAVVYLARLPEFRFVVHDEDGWFVLHMTKELADDFGAKGLEIVVHSPAFQISGGYESVKRKKDDGAIEIELELTPVFELVVDVTPPEAVEAGVRVWVERRGAPGGPDEDDSLYMSAKVPSSGRLHFMIPEHYGELTFGATGAHWHSGLTRKAKGWGWKKSKLKLNVGLELANDNCDYVRGEVVNGTDYSIKARLESTHFGVVTYAGGDGNFEMYVPFERTAGTRQFIATAAHYRPEVVPLENHGEPTRGVDGAAPHGPWNVKLAYLIPVTLEVPKDVLRDNDAVRVDSNRLDKTKQGRKEAGLDLRWGQRLITFTSDPSGTVYVGYISDQEWERAFKHYAAGSEGPIPIRFTSLEEALKNR